MREIALSLGAIFIVESLSLGCPRDRVFIGEVMDSQCARLGSHRGMMKAERAQDGRECTLRCAQRSGRFVLYDAERKATYQLYDQDRAKQFAGEKVKLTGTYDRKTHTIRFNTIEAVD
jgi:hypothetical protein